MENNTNDILREQEEVGGLNQVIDSATADEDVSVREDFTANASGVELTSLRGANWKVFDMGHGRRQAIYYAEPVHYLSGGRFVDIDNRLTLDRSANVMLDGYVRARYRHALHEPAQCKNRKEGRGRAAT